MTTFLGVVSAIAFALLLVLGVILVKPWIMRPLERGFDLLYRYADWVERKQRGL